MPIETQFKCSTNQGDYIVVDSDIDDDKVFVTAHDGYGGVISVCLDTTTAIKLSKSIRTEINKLKGVNRG